MHSVDQYPAARRRPANSCIHCHHVYDFRREALQAQGKWSKDQLWAYPLPENVGVTLEVDEGELVKAVAAGSPGDRAGSAPATGSNASTVSASPRLPTFNTPFTALPQSGKFLFPGGAAEPSRLVDCG